MSGGVVSFGGYIFSSPLTTFTSNFSNAVPKTVRLPGLDGGFNLDGDEAADRETGRVTVGFMLQADTREDMDALRDAVNAMYDYGLAQLLYQPTDTAEATRYCWASVNYITMSQRKDAHTDLWQPVQIIFQVPDPTWIVQPSGAWLIGDGSLIGEPGLIIGGGAVTISASGTSSSGTVTNSGNVRRIGRVYVTPGVGDSCENPTIKRVVGGIVADSVTWTGTLNAGDVLVIDGARQQISINWVADWDNVSYQHPDFLRLLPGSNSIVVEFTNAGDAAEVEIYYEDGYL